MFLSNKYDIICESAQLIALLSIAQLNYLRASKRSRCGSAWILILPARWYDEIVILREAFELAG